MALSTYIVYLTATGEILHGQNRQDTNPPSTNAGESLLDMGGHVHPLPSNRTHYVDIGGAPTLAAKNGSQQQSESDARRKREVEMQLAHLDALTPRLQARGFTEAKDAIEAQIVTLETEHASLP